MELSFAEELAICSGVSLNYEEFSHTRGDLLIAKLPKTGTARAPSLGLAQTVFHPDQDRDARVSEPDSPNEEKKQPLIRCQNSSECCSISDAENSY